MMLLWPVHGYLLETLHSGLWGPPKSGRTELKKHQTQAGAELGETQGARLFLPCIWHHHPSGPLPVPARHLCRDDMKIFFGNQGCA